MWQHGQQAASSTHLSIVRLTWCSFFAAEITELFLLLLLLFFHGLTHHYLFTLATLIWIWPPIASSISLSLSLFFWLSLWSTYDGYNSVSLNQISSHTYYILSDHCLKQDRLGNLAQHTIMVHTRSGQVSQHWHQHQQHLHYCYHRHQDLPIVAWVVVVWSMVCAAKSQSL